MATFKLFSPAIINNSPIILIKFYDEKHPYKIILCEFLLNNNAVLNTSVVWKRLEGGNMCQKFEGFKLLHLHSAHRKSLDAVCKKKAAITKVNGKLLEDLLGSCSAAASDLCQGSRTNLQSIKAVAPPVTVWCRWNRWLIFIYVVKKGTYPVCNKSTIKLTNDICIQYNVLQFAVFKTFTLLFN